MNYISRIVRLIQTGILSFCLVSCTLTPIPDLPGKIVYTVDVSDNNKAMYAWDIYVMNPDGSNQVRLTNTGRNLSPAWSPDGKQIVFSSENTDIYDLRLHIMNADGTDIHAITIEDKYAGNSAWSPNGKEIAFTVGIGGSILFATIDGSSPISSFPLLKDDGVVLCSSPSWSPDSKYLIVSCSSTKEDKSWNIYKFKADGSSFDCLTCVSILDVEFFGDAHWSPDGSHIGFTGWFFANSNTQKSMFFLMSADGSDQKPLITTQIPGRIADWAWSPDGQWIVVVSYENPALQFYKVDGTQFYQIEDLPGVPISVDWGK